MEVTGAIMWTFSPSLFLTKQEGYQAVLPAKILQQPRCVVISLAADLGNAG